MKTIHVLMIAMAGLLCVAGGCSKQQQAVAIEDDAYRGEAYPLYLKKMREIKSRGLFTDGVDDQREVVSLTKTPYEMPVYLEKPEDKKPTLAKKALDEVESVVDDTWRQLIHNDDASDWSNKESF